MSHFRSEGVARPKAVVCDDDAVTRRLVREVLERCGYDVLAGVDNALVALDLVLQHQPDVIVLDLVLPGMSGEEIIEAIQGGSDTQVVVHSSFDPRFAVKSGARMFVQKGNVAALEAVLMRARGSEVPA